jgi:hypothetical protein
MCSSISKQIIRYIIIVLAKHKVAAFKEKKGFRGEPVLGTTLGDGAHDKVSDSSSAELSSSCRFTSGSRKCALGTSISSLTFCYVTLDCVYLWSSSTNIYYY